MVCITTYEIENLEHVKVRKFCITYFFMILDIFRVTLAEAEAATRGVL